MYYEDRIIDGKLYYRTTPDGNWMEEKSARAIVINILHQMTENQRLDCLRFFCSCCGSTKLPCYCMHDE